MRKSKQYCRNNLSRKKRSVWVEVETHTVTGFGLLRDDVRRSPDISFDVILVNALEVDSLVDGNIVAERHVRLVNVGLNRERGDEDPVLHGYA